MPPKFNPDDPATAALITLFTSLGVAPASATELVKQPKQGQAFKGLIDEFRLEDVEQKLDEKQAAALVKLATTGGKLGQGEKGFVVQKVLKGDIKSPDQVTGTFASKCREAGNWDSSGPRANWLMYSCHQVLGDESDGDTGQ